MARELSVQIAKEIVVAWLGTHDVTALDDKNIGERIATVFKRIVDEVENNLDKTGPSVKR